MARLRGALTLVLLHAIGLAACAPPPPDLLLVNARVFTADPANPWDEAIAIRGERIVGVGSSTEMSTLAGPATATRDVGGRVIIPGFNDAHVADRGLDAHGIRAFVQAGLASGITSMQWFVAERTVREAGAALVEAGTPVRFRVFRMPRPGPDGHTIDSRPHLPPQPSLRVDIRGMAFAPAEADVARLTQAVGWAYGTEDLLAIEPATDAVLGAYLNAVEHTGLPEVWASKRPRVEQAGAAAVSMAARLRVQGMVVVQRPDGPRPLETLVREGVPLALGSGRAPAPFAVLAWATSRDRGSEALTMEEAVTAFTRGSAYAEFSDRDKGRVSVGALADLAVLSLDPFTAPPDRLLEARSVLTVAGGRVVHDVP